MISCWQPADIYASLYNTYFRHQSLEYVERVGEYLKEEKAIY
jgi:hypothetical protein